MLEEIRSLLDTLTLRQKLVITVAAAGVLGGLYAFLHWQNERDFAVLYSNLSAEDAAAVVTRLKETGAEYRLSPDSATIKVKSGRIPDVRLQMAAAGIPKSGRIGYELFDRNNFGVTEFAEQVNYHRALEGELERTISTITEVEQARVHITARKDSVFADHREPAKASVLLRLRRDQQLASKNVQAISFLVSNAVEGLSPDRVSILDVHGTLLTAPRHDGELNESLHEYRRSIERDLLAKINSTLTPLLGPDRFRAAVSADVDYSSSDQSDEAYDPARSVMTTSQRTEDQSAQSQPAGVPGAPSNLPRPTSRPGTGAANGLLRRTENINFQSSRTVRRTHTPQGSLKRLSVSVLLDHELRWEGEGTKVRPVAQRPSAERLKAVREVLSAVIGFQAERGDQLVVESLPFEQTVAVVSPAPPPPAGAPGSAGQPAPSFWQWYGEAVKRRDMAVLGVTGGAGLLVMLAVAGALRIGKRKRRKGVRGATVDVAELPSPKAPTATAIQQSPGDAVFEAQMAAQRAQLERKEKGIEQEILSELTASVKLPSTATKKAEVLAKHLSEEAKRDPEGMAQIVRTWMTDGDG